VGVAARVRVALYFLRSKPVDLAVVDLNVAGELAYPVAKELLARGIPFIFTSGLDATVLAAGPLSMLKRTELCSADLISIGPKSIMTPADLLAMLHRRPKAGSLASKRRPEGR